MRIVYLGTPEFAVEPLRNLVKNGYDVVAVITAHDKPVGRKSVLTPPPIKVEANKLGIPVYQFKSIRKEGVETLRSLKPDLMITCAFGQILSQEVLDVPTMYTLNIHGSILPELRGAAPIQYALLEGKTKTGITIMKTDVGIDTGDILIKSEIEIDNQINYGELSNRLSSLGAELIVKALKLIENNEAKFIKQDNSKATFTKMIKAEDEIINFYRPAKEIHDKVRAYNPNPAARTTYDGTIMKIYKTKVIEEFGQFGFPGQVIISSPKIGLVVACGRGSIEIQELQMAGGKVMLAKSYLNGKGIELGAVLGK